MTKQILILLALFLTHPVLSQLITVEAVYYNNSGVPYKIEKKFSHTNTVSYLRHDNQGSVCVKQLTSYKGDSTIIKETSYRIFYVKTKLERFMDCEIWTTASNLTGDTVTLQASELGTRPEALIFVGDTILTGADATKQAAYFREHIRELRLPLILSGKLKVNMDSLILMESTIIHYFKGIPVHVEVFDSKNKKQSSSLGRFSKNKLIWNCYFDGKTNLVYQTDTIIWNKDTTEIVWHSISKEHSKWETRISYRINGRVLNCEFSDGLSKKIEYLDAKGVFRNLLIREYVNNDNLYSIELRHLDREKIGRISSYLQFTSIEYTFDKQNRMTEQLFYENGDLQRRVMYKYEK